MSSLRILFALFLAATLAEAQAVWQRPAAAGVALDSVAKDDVRVVSSEDDNFEILSEQELPARPGDAFEIAVRVKVDLHTRAIPELACFDASGRPIRGRNILATGPSTTTTNWRDLRRVFPALPGTAHVRVRIRASGRGQIHLGALTFQPTHIDPYQTGALITQIYPGSRNGLMLESNLGIINADRVSNEDRDGDGKWALIKVDLDQLSKMPDKGVDWRSSFEYKPNEIYWSDGAVLKSDSIKEDRAPDAARALHFRMKVHPGPYRAIMNDPGRAVAISLDGKTWKRFEGGQEIELGVMPAQDGFLELWVDACYRDPVTVGPVYFDYIRLYPKDDPAADERLFNAAHHVTPVLTRGSVDEKTVAIHFDAPVFGSGAAWPVRCGIPIPRGELASAQNATIMDAAGHAIPTQNRSLAQWPDGSVKWLYLDFLHHASAPGNVQYRLAYGNRVQARAAVKGVALRKTDAGIEVDTGAVRFLVPRAHFGVIEGREGPVSAEITEANGKTWRALDLPVEKLEIEQAGPMHAVIVAETKLAASGKPASGFYHRAAIHVYAGSPLVEVDYFVANTDERERIQARSIVLRIPEKGIAASGAVVDPDGKSTAAGWIAPQGAPVSAGIEYFHEQFPKALRWKPGELEIALWAPEGGDYDWVQGVGKTHHIALWYGPQQTDASLLAKGPVLAVADPKWYAASGAMGRIGTAAESPLPAVEQTLNRHMAETMVGKVGLGFENYGDHSSHGYVAGSFLWDNNEYDVPAAAMVHFARTGDLAALRLGLASARHYLDVDMIHYSRQHPDWGGSFHTHSHSDVGPHTAEAPGMHHAGYVQGLIWYSYLTGDPTGVEGAKTIADWVLKNIRPESNIGSMERATGHPLMTLTDVYEATGEEQYLRGAAKLVDWAMKWEHPVHSGFLAPITEQPAYYSGSGFNSGLVEAGMMKFNSWADLPEIDAMLERNARFLLTEMWRPPAGILFKGGPASRKAGGAQVSSHLRAFRLEYERTGDPLFLTAPRDMIVASFGEKAHDIASRETGLVFNYLPWYLSLLHDLGDPQPDSQIQLTPKGDTCVSIRNTGSNPVDHLRISYQPRLDFTVVKAPQIPASLAPGQSAESCADVRFPTNVNLTSEYNRVSYAHWSVSLQRDGKLGTAHTFVKIELHDSK
jgi:hypothetical protein